MPFKADVTTRIYSSSINMYAEVDVEMKTIALNARYKDMAELIPVLVLHIPASA